MITKYNEFLNEKLSDKLSGFNEEGLKQQFLNGETIISPKSTIMLSIIPYLA
jgi:hypothetical protein